jgi:hypothetical protein
VLHAMACAASTPAKDSVLRSYEVQLLTGPVQSLAGSYLKGFCRTVCMCWSLGGLEFVCAGCAQYDVGDLVLPAQGVCLSCQQQAPQTGFGWMCTLPMPCPVSEA